MWAINETILKVVLAAALIVAAAVGVYWAGYQAAESKWAQRQLAAEQAARTKEQALSEQRAKIERAYAAAKSDARAAAKSADVELERMRDQLARADSRQCAATEPRVDEAHRATRDILSACSTALVRMAAEADEIRLMADGLQAYVRDVCAAK